MGFSKSNPIIGMGSFSNLSMVMHEEPNVDNFDEAYALLKGHVSLSQHIRKEDR